MPCKLLTNIFLPLESNDGKTVLYSVAVLNIAIIYSLLDNYMAHILDYNFLSSLHSINS